MEMKVFCRVGFFWGVGGCEFGEFGGCEFGGVVGLSWCK